MVEDSTFRRTPNFNLQALKNGLLDGDRVSLARAITLIESKRQEDKKLANQLLDFILPETGKSLRIGLTGVPGVGKSTFIEAFGKKLTEIGLKVAILSIDPSSTKTKGSILGDKTRMTLLSNDPNAYIRPSASGNTLGGVAASTREAMLLCEAAGYEIIIVETVGVGQSETLVKDMVDYFLLLMLAGSGDELQGIKRGIMEIADHIVINKADGENIKQAKKSREDFKNAIHLFPKTDSEWVVPVGTCSAIEKTGMDEIWDQIQHFQKLTEANGWLKLNREKQILSWFHERIESTLRENFYSQPNMVKKIREMEEKISSNKLSIRAALDELFS